ncbi:glutathione peroxidase [Pelagovum pacificum]|uniref:Glutathione peroxidase n=1 Tax=Pelagovum pacificum TaxID=2588711 RepID=A0A5C5GA63_9RHOB|nr:glutathione peroxidase [Pelagovum pacificum]QQA41581.1 glutathione peroxidase [Pelagovum pacificum]TNY30860.1 glutathione peroxidase [Pelagovum pacificum]
MVSFTRRNFLAALATVTATLAAAPAAIAGGDVIGQFSFDSIDGGSIALSDYAGQPILLANTASLCAFTPQYDDLQALWEQYREAGLVVLAIPSDDFRQELGSDGEVRDFCAMNFGLDMPMSTITHVRGDDAHPLFDWLERRGVTPTWNFHKVLIGADGEILQDWPSAVNPMSRPIRSAVEAALAG